MCNGPSFVDFFVFSVPHRCKKILIFLVFFLGGTTAGQPSGQCGTSTGRGHCLLGLTEAKDWLDMGRGSGVAWAMVWAAFQK